jgi:hypothetical protein
MSCSKVFSVCLCPLVMKVMCCIAVKKGVERKGKKEGKGLPDAGGSAQLIVRGWAR